MNASVMAGTRLASPVKFDDEGRKRFGVLVAHGERLQLQTAEGVLLDADRRELIEPVATTSLPRVRFRLAGRAYDLRLIGASKRHDTAALESAVRHEPYFAQQAAAVSLWHNWFNPATPEQQAVQDRAALASANEERFRASEVLDGPAIQGRVWDTVTGRLSLLTRTDSQLTLTHLDGTVVPLGSVHQVRARYTGRGSRTVLHLQTPGGMLTLALRQPPVRGGGGGAGLDEPLLWLILFPVGLTLIYLDRRAVRRRAKAWKSALPAF